MTRFLNGSAANGEFSRQFAQSILRAVEKKYGALICDARGKWEHDFAGRDPGDACVSIARQERAAPPRHAHHTWSLQRRRATFVTQ